MARYTADSRDRVRDAVDMLALVGSRVELRRAGVNSYFGRCPFHDERTASFHVRPDEKHYHCFGCSESGDPFDFVMQTEGLPFKEALESLAERFGVPLQSEEEDPQAAERRARRERLTGLLARAATYYARTLWQSSEAAPALRYLREERGMSEEVLREFKVGYAPKAWDKLLLGSRRAGYTDDELVAVGLAQRSHSRPGQIYDRFRGRIMFPSADARGRVRGFGARAMGADQQPKYLNTADGELYHKREQLYGIDRARAAAAKAGRMILVEGYTDVLALHQAGITNAVGIMGTSFTEEQLAELARVVGVLELCLDADDAGRQAMMKAAALAAGRGLELRVVPLPPGRDPGDMIAREGAGALREAVARSEPFNVFRVARILEAVDLTSAEDRDRALREVTPLVAALPEGILRDELVRRVSGRLALSPERTARLSGRPVAVGARAGRPSGPDGRGAADGPGAAARRAETARDAGDRGERAFLVLCVALPDAGRAALAEIDPDRHLQTPVFRRAGLHLRAQGPERPLAGLPDEDEALARTVADLVARAGRSRDIGPDNLEHARLMLELGAVERELRRARADQSGSVTDLARRLAAVRAEIGAIVGRLEDAG